MSYLVEKEQIENFSIEISYCDCADSPRDWDNFGTMVCFHNRYDLGDKTNFSTDMFDSWAELERLLIEEENAHTVLPIYMYDHSGITISSSPFGCRWDSGQVGFIYVTRDKVIDEKITDASVIDFLRCEIETYDKYLRGEVYQYRVNRIDTCNLNHEHAEVVDSCGGFYDLEECKREARAYVDYYLKETTNQ
jgi:hypothetical protein